MKILRHHRGFTTNSSASSEWVYPPPEELMVPVDEAEADDAEDTGDAPAGPAPGPGGDADPGRIEGAGPATGTAVAPREPAAERPSYLVDNLLLLGGMLLAILGVFALERTVRTVLRRRRQAEEDDDV